MMKIASYQEVRPLMKPGDILGLGGYAPGSLAIKFCCKSVLSHLSTVLMTSVTQEDGCVDKYIVDMMEANQRYTDPVTGIRYAGVHRSRLSTRIEHYDGDVWWLPLSEESRARFDETAFVSFLLEMEKNQTAYDVSQALSSWKGMNDEDLSEVFCSELTTAAQREGKVLPEFINPSNTTPKEGASYQVFADDYYCLKAKSEYKEIEEYNSIAVWEA
jgi:hypothetical protein